MHDSFIIARALWWRHWLYLSLAMVILLLPHVVVPLLPLSDAWRSNVYAASIVAAVVSVCVYAIGILSFGLESDMSMPDSGFPKYNFTIPLSTWKIIFWPVVLQSLFVAFFWTVIHRTLWWNLSVSSTLEFWMPLCWIVGTAVWIQAVSWTPFSSRLSNITSIAAFFMICALVGVVCWSNLLAPAAAWSIHGVYLGASLWCVHRCVVSARRGDTIDLEHALPGLPSLFALLRAMGTWDFWSPESDRIMPTQALQWRIKSRLNFWFAVWNLMFAIPVTWFGLKYDGEGEAVVLGIVVAYLNFFVTFAVISQCVIHEKGVQLPSYLATLPITTGQFIRAYVPFAFRAILWGWLMFSTILVLVMIVQYLALGHVWTGLKQLDRAYGSGAGIRLACAAVIAGVLFQISSGLTMLALGFSGRQWLTTTVSCMVSIVPLSLFFVGLIMYSRDPIGFLPYVSQFIPHTAAGLVLLKAVANAASTPAIVRAVGRPQWAKDIGVWAVSMIVISVVLCLLVPSNVVSSILIIAYVALMVPLATIRLPVIALRWNRHR